MKRWLAVFILALGSRVFAQTAALPVQSCQSGATQAQVSGMASTNYLQGVVPSCTVTIYLTGTTTPATYYFSQGGSPQTGPFTASPTGQWLAYTATNVGYDVVLSGGICPNCYTAPVTITGVYPGQQAGGSGTVSGQLSGTIPLNTNGVSTAINAASALSQTGSGAGSTVTAAGTVAAGAGTFGTLQNRVLADSQSGADICAKITTSIALVSGSLNGVVETEANQSYATCAAGIVVPLNVTLDCHNSFITTGSGAAIGIQVAGPNPSAPAPQPGGATGGVVNNCFFFGPGSATSTTGLFLGGTATSGCTPSSTTGNCWGYQKLIHNVGVYGYGIGVSWGINSYIVNLEDIDLERNGTGLQPPASGTPSQNSGERMVISGLIANNTNYGIYSTNPDQELRGIGLSIDYNGVDVYGSVDLQCVGCHLESDNVASPSGYLVDQGLTTNYLRFAMFGGYMTWTQTGTYTLPGPIHVARVNTAWIDLLGSVEVATNTLSGVLSHAVYTAGAGWLQGCAGNIVTTGTNQAPFAFFTDAAYTLCNSVGQTAYAPFYVPTTALSGTPTSGYGAYFNVTTGGTANYAWGANGNTITLLPATSASTADLTSLTHNFGSGAAYLTTQAGKTVNLLDCAATSGVYTLTANQYLNTSDIVSFKGLTNCTALNSAPPLHVTSPTSTQFQVTYGSATVSSAAETGTAYSSPSSIFTGYQSISPTQTWITGQFGNTAYCGGFDATATGRPCAVQIDPGGVINEALHVTTTGEALAGTVTPYGNLTLTALSTPVNATFTTALSGGSCSDTTAYYYRVAALNSIGTTLASTETSVTTGASGSNINTVTVVWGDVYGATSYNIYGRTSGAEQLIASTANGNYNSYVDTCTIVPSGALPTVNTTIGAIGTGTGLLAGFLYSAAGRALPSCVAGLNGERATVSDATTGFTYYGAYTSGGTITWPVVCSYSGSAYAWHMD